MTLRKLDRMSKGKWAGLRAQLKEQRLGFLWGCANIVCAIYATAGKTCESPPELRDIFSQMTGEHVPEPEPQQVEGPVCASLAKLWEERRAREAANVKTIH